MINPPHSPLSTAKPEPTMQASAPPASAEYVPMKKLPRREGSSIDYLIEHYQRNNGTVS